MNQLSFNKIKKMDPVGIRFNLHPLVLFILSLIGIYVLYKAFWPKDKVFYRWKPSNGAFLNTGQCKNMSNVASPALGNKFLPTNQRYGCSGAVEIVNGTAVQQQWLCQNKEKILWEEILDTNGNTMTLEKWAKNGANGIVGNNITLTPGEVNWVGSKDANNWTGTPGLAPEQEDLSLQAKYKDANVMGDGIAYRIGGRIDANTPWYSDCCVWDPDGATRGGGGVCRPKVNSDGPRIPTL